MNKTEILQNIKKYKPANPAFDEIIQHLINIIGKIPEENMGEGTDMLVREDNTLVVLLKHGKDQLRFVQLFITAENILVNVCFMKDSLLHSFAKTKGSNSFTEFSKLYLDTIFGKGFEKKIVQGKREVFECELCFDDKNLPNKLYITRKNRFIKFFTGAPKRNVQQFRYLSFFEHYDYAVKNEIIER